jgi:hypothetical protein
LSLSGEKLVTGEVVLSGGGMSKATLRRERVAVPPKDDSPLTRWQELSSPTYNITGPPSVGTAGVSPVARKSFFIGFIESLRHREAPRYGSAWGAY